MAYVQPQAPNVNGVMELSATKIETLRNQLDAIVSEFVPSEEYPVISTFYIVVKHTQKHGTQTTFTQLNGDTVEFLLGLQENAEEFAETPKEGE
jgi:ABC-type phosphate transport system substrate-binding protein